MNSKTTVTLIARNEAANLPACIASIMVIIEDIIVVDPGSTEDTRTVGSTLGARVFEFPWCECFPASRNVFLRHVCGPWVLWLDKEKPPSTPPWCSQTRPWGDDETIQ
jgi:glycosyltransferase involved in cell wall biosynthesis